MVATPALTPVTTPLLLFTVAVPVAALLHVPPPVVVVSVAVPPTHTAAIPLIAAGTAYTVTIFTDAQPAVVVNVMGATPANIPVTMALVAPTLAVVSAPLPHVPDPAVSVVVVPTHSPPAPLIPKVALTVIVRVTAQLPNE